MGSPISGDCPHGGPVDLGDGFRSTLASTPHSVERLNPVCRTHANRAKTPEWGEERESERGNSERLGLIGRLTRPKRRPGPQCAQIEPRNPPQAATAAVMASTPRMLSARRKL